MGYRYTAMTWLASTIAVGVLVIAAGPATAAPALRHDSVRGLSVASGPLVVTVNADLSILVTLAGHGTATARPPSLFLDGAPQICDNTTGGGLSCICAAASTAVRGHDAFGSFVALGINCTAGIARTRVDYSIKAYDSGGNASGSRWPMTDGMLLFDVAMPDGATGLQMRRLDLNDISPPQFAPFPAFDATSPPLKEAVTMCYGSQRPHMFVNKGIAALDPRCTTLSGGMTVLAWPDEGSPSSVAGAVVTAANEFHLNFNRLSPILKKSAVAGENCSLNDMPTPRSLTWTHGLSGEISEVPAGFVGRTMLYYSGAGINPAVDGWGTTLRNAYAARKRDAEDIFLQAVSMWTDNVCACTSQGHIHIESHNTAHDQAGKSCCNST